MQANIGKCLSSLAALALIASPSVASAQPISAEYHNESSSASTPWAVEVRDGRHSLDAGEVAQARIEWDKFGVPRYQQDKIVKRLGRGILPDAFTGEKDPVSFEERYVDGLEYSVTRYPDGSYVASGMSDVPLGGVSAEDGGIRPLAHGIGACTSKYSSIDYTIARGCRVYATWFSIGKLEFQVDYSQETFGEGRILAYNRPVTACSIVTCGQPYFERIKLVSDSRGEAIVRLNSHVTGPRVSYTTWVDFKVHGTKAWTSAYQQ